MSSKSASPRKAARNSKKARGRARDLKEKEAAAGVAALKRMAAENKERYGRSQRTRENYARYLSQGKEFLEHTVSDRREPEPGSEAPDDGIDTDLLAKAFDDPPNIHSVDALELFLADKCFHQGCGKSVADVVQAAFADYWSRM
jgi:hypothetical protein